MLEMLSVLLVKHLMKICPNPAIKMKSVKGYPELAGDPHNIQFLTRSEHIRAHGGNFRNITHGRFRIGD